MKILLFITGYRHLIEYNYLNLFLKNLKLNNICDIFIYCNNPEISPEIINYYQQYEQKNKQLFITTLNGGHCIGGIEAVSQGFEMGIFKDYDYVIHIHPDVFITEDKYIMNILEENKNNDTVFFVTNCFMGEESMFAFDFFIFKPKLLKTNIFYDELYTFQNYPEQYFRNMIIKNDIKHVLIKRFENDYWFPRRIDDYLKLYHEHEMDKVENVLKEMKLI